MATSGWLHASIEHPWSSQPATGALSGKKRKATRNPAVPESWKNAMNAAVASVHLLFCAIDPDRSKVTNMFTGEKVAAAEPTAHAASAVVGPPPAPEPALPEDASTVMIPPFPVAPPAPTPLLVVETLAPAAPGLPCPEDVLLPPFDPNVLSRPPAEQASALAQAATSHTARAVTRSRFTLYLQLLDVRACDGR
jgi:hypothetical protein